ncbi:MAG: 50S ribosomal protein L13 [Planctomycetes bacterium]|nr:50S ribosomal protein L13 [Planctomycetota bacterium]
MDKTYRAKPGEVLQSWHHFDAEGAVLGRMASRIALILQGKHHARYTPETDTGDFVVVTNATKVFLSGNKADDRMQRWHTGYMGGLREMSSGEMRERHPERLVMLAVRRMMPKTILGRRMLKKLKVYPGAEHIHSAQQPVAVDMTPYLPKQDS